jgi:hypothetical protein
MSGAVVWAFEANRRPFLLIAHPLKFLAGVAAADRAEVERGMATQPPGIIVLDGYTERTFGKAVPTLSELLKEAYEPIARWEGGRHPLQVYRRRDSTGSPSALPPARTSEMPGIRRECAGLPECATGG